MKPEDSTAVALGQGKSGRGKKLIKLLVLALFVVFAVLLFLVPGFVSSRTGQKLILEKINDSIDGKADFAELSMGWFKGVQIRDFSLSDDVSQTSVHIKRLTVKPHYVHLLFGNLSFGKTVINEPKIRITLPADKPPHPPGTERGPRGQPGHVAVPIERIDLAVADGSVEITDASSGTVELTQVNSSLRLRPPGQKSIFDVNMVVVAAGRQSKVNAAGEVVPKRKTGWTLEGTTGRLAVETTELDIASLGPLLALTGLDIRAGGKVTVDLNTDLRDGRIEKLSGTIKATDLDIGIPARPGDKLTTSRFDLAIELKADEQALNINKLSVRTDWLEADAAGVVPKTIESLTDFLKPEFKYDLKADFQCDLAPLLSQMPTTFGLPQAARITSGTLTGNIETATLEARRQIVGRAELKDLRGAVADKPVALVQPITAEARISSDKTGIKYDKLQFASSFAQLSCWGTNKLLEYDAKVDLAKFQARLGQFVDLGRYQTAGKLTGSGKLTAKKNKISVTGSSAIENLRLTYPGREPFEQRQVSIEFDIDADTQSKTLNVKRFLMTSPDITIEKTLSITTRGGNSKLSGKAHLKYDWSKLSRMVSAFLPAGFRMTGRRADTITFSSEYPTAHNEKLFANLNAGGKLGFESAEYMGLNFGPTEVDVRITNGRLNIAPFSTTVNNGRLTFAATADFAAKPVLLQTPAPMHIAENVEIDQRTTRQLLMYLNPVFAEVAAVRGVADFQCEKLEIPLAGGSRNDITVIGTISVSKLRLQGSQLLGVIMSVVNTDQAGADITIHPTRFVLQNGLLRYDDMQMDIGDHPVNFSGTIGLDKRLNMNVVLPYSLDFEPVRVSEASIDQRISLPLTGTINAPELDIARLLQQQLLQRGLRELFK